MQGPETNAFEITRIVTSAVAPVFLLSGIGSFILIMATRLQRITDRMRTLEGNASPDFRQQQILLRRRGRLIHRGMSLLTLAGQLVCLIVIVIFVDFFTEWAVESLVAALFIGTMVCIALALAFLLREVWLVGDGFPTDEP
jgi:membrane-bound metal-dependent hydrolase YbcI (DUF457 family)